MIKTLLPGVALADLLNRVIDGADALTARGYGPDFDDYQDIPLELAAELASLAAECKLCRIGPSSLSDHWVQWKTCQLQERYERGLPTWTCRCGHVYKREASEREDRFCQPRDDGLLGALAGTVRRDAKGKVKHSDACPACGVKFAVAVELQAIPEGALF